MKKILFIATVVLFTFSYSNAQELGIRFGGVNGGGGAAVDGIFTLGQFSRVHADVGFFQSSMGIDALWDFVYNPLGAEALNWYAGVGPSLLIGDDIGLGVSGEIGLEYRFTSAPITLGLDWRPTFWIIDNTKIGVDSFGLNVRYVFGGN